MSLTSYRAAPPRAIALGIGLWRFALLEPDACFGALPPLISGRPKAGRSRGRYHEEARFRVPDGKAWRRPTLPRVGSQYHGRTGVSRPSSEWVRVVHPGCDHQAVRSGDRAAGFPGWGWAVRSGSRATCLRVKVVVRLGILCLVEGDGRMLPRPLSRLGELWHGWARSWRGASSIERLGSVSFTHCCASTADLSTWWSSTALERDLVLRWVSRLDAFSGYPVRI